MSAVLLILARVARLGFLANFLSRTVLIGFLSGVGVQVAFGSLAGMLGLSGRAENVFGQVEFLIRNFDRVSVPTLGLSIAVVALIAGLRRISPRIPAALIAIVAGIAGVWLFHLKSHGILVVGAIPTGIPRIGFPDIALNWNMIQTLGPTAFAMFVVILTQSAATSRAYAERSGEPFDENVDLVGLAAANIGAAFSGTFVVNGSPTKTQIVDAAGGTSQVSQITACCIVLIILFFLTGPLALMPTAVLSTVVFMIGAGLVDVRGMKRILAERPYEFWVALTTAAAVVFAGVEASILLAIVLSLAVHTRHGYLVRNVLLVPGPAGWHQERIETCMQAAPGLVMYRFLHNMYYANSHVLRDDIVGTIARARPPLSRLCIDMAARQRR